MAIVTMAHYLLFEVDVLVLKKPLSLTGSDSVGEAMLCRLFCFSIRSKSLSAFFLEALFLIPRREPL